MFMPLAAHQMSLQKLGEVNVYMQSHMGSGRVRIQAKVWTRAFALLSLLLMIDPMPVDAPSLPGQLMAASSKSVLPWAAEPCLLGSVWVHVVRKAPHAMGPWQTHWKSKIYPGPNAIWKFGYWSGGRNADSKLWPCKENWLGTFDVKKTGYFYTVPQNLQRSHSW